MKEVIKVLKELANTSSRNDKETILKNNIDNELLKDVLQFIYDPFILTGLSKKKINKNTNFKPAKELNNIYEAMDYLKSNNTGRDIDIAYIRNFIKQQETELQPIFKQIFAKELKTGVTAKTLNKVYGKGFINEFSVMLAKKFEDHQHKIQGEFVVTEKLDGNRILIIKDNGVIKSFTRQGKQYEGLEEIELDIANLDDDNIVFDGELIADTEGSSHEVYTETTSKARKNGANKTGLIFHIFDVLSLQEFLNGKSNMNCIDRKKYLSILFNDYNFKHCKQVSPLYVGKDLSRIDELMNMAMNNGWEGLMVNLDKPYVCKRSDYILKVKTMNSCDLMIIGFVEGEGKYNGKLGALIVDYKGYNVGVGSGFSDYDRENIWTNKDEYLGKIIEVQYFEESKNQDGSISLRFPVYKGIRDDKVKPSYH